MNVVTDKKEIENFLDRGVENIFPGRDWLMDKMQSGGRLTMYLGIDPTGPTLHIGHSVQLIKLAEWQRLGHKAILLIGDFTATIGDPTDKQAARVPQTRDQVLENAKKYKEQASIFLDFDGENKAELMFNSDWLGKMDFADVLVLASYATVGQMIKRDMFQKRIEEGKEIYLHEFLYPLMQGFDSVAMDTDGEVGGNDQTFNMLAGRDLLKKIKNKEKFVIADKLLADPSGKKMGKTEGNMITMIDSPDEIYGKVMSWTDGMIVPALEILTRIPMQEVKNIEKELENGANPRDAKMKLAKILVSIYHDQKEADNAENKFIETFRQNKIPEDIKEVKIEKNTPLMDVLVESEIVASKSDFRRLVDEGAVSVDGDRISDANYQVQNSSVVKVGKKRFLKLVL